METQHYQGESGDYGASTTKNNNRDRYNNSFCFDQIEKGNPELSPSPTPNPISPRETLGKSP